MESAHGFTRIARILKEKQKADWTSHIFGWSSECESKKGKLENRSQKLENRSQKSEKQKRFHPPLSESLGYLE